MTKGGEKQLRVVSHIPPLIVHGCTEGCGATEVPESPRGAPGQAQGWEGDAGSSWRRDTAASPLRQAAFPRESSSVSSGKGGAK